MRRHVGLVIGMAALAGSPAVAGVIVLGNSPGHGCYRSAVAQNGSQTALEGCDAAFEHDLTRQDEVATYVNRGIVRLYGRDFQGAIADFDHAIAMDPDQPESYLNRGSALLRMGVRSDEPVTMFDAALANGTRRPELAYFGRAIANEVNGDVNAAYRDYRRASETAPQWDAPRGELARFTVARRPK